MPVRNRRRISTSRRLVTTISDAFIKFSRLFDIVALRKDWQKRPYVITRTQTHQVLSTIRCSADFLRGIFSIFIWKRDGSSSAVKALALDSSLMTWKDEVMTAINKLVIQSI